MRFVRISAVAPAGPTGVVLFGLTEDGEVFGYNRTMGKWEPLGDDVLWPEQ